MASPKFKVKVTHDSVSTDYESETFTQVQVKRRENSYDVATLTLADSGGDFYLGSVEMLDEAKVYLKADAGDAWTQVFGGQVRQVNPYLSTGGKVLQLLCKGYGAALEETHCNRDYGAESKNSSLDTVKEILQDLVDNMINKSLGSANVTGYAITKTKIADIQAATKIKYVNNPYKTNLEALDVVCELATAIAAGSAGPHWIVDNSKNLIVNTIGAHEDTTEWPDWWNTDQPGSTLVEGVDFVDRRVLDKTEEFANHVVLVTDFRRPAYDYWTEDSFGFGNWGIDTLEDIIDDNAAGHVVVGSHSMKFNPDGAVAGYGYIPKTADAGWDVTKWGSERTIPTVNFYCLKHMLTAATTYLYMSTNTTARKTDYFYVTFLNWQSESDDVWLHKSIPIGPYWARTEESRLYRWGVAGTPLWTKIDSLEFMISLAGENGYLLVDDLHFKGQIARSARKAASITANNEYQKVLISRNAMDDSCIASDDTGFAGRIAYAELLRRLALPTTLTIQIPGKPAMMAGQKAHIHACKTSAGDFQVNKDMRLIEVQHDMDAKGGFVTTATLTSDLTNSTVMSNPDQYAMWQENMFLNSKEAKNIRAGSEVDLLIPVLTKNY